MSPLNGRIIVLTPGKPVPLSEYPKPVRTVTLAPLDANTTAIYIGGPGVRARDGEANGLPVDGATPLERLTWNDVDLSQIWIDAVTANEGVSYLAWA